jgi:hypothetical protein
MRELAALDSRDLLDCFGIVALPRPVARRLLSETEEPIRGGGGCSSCTCPAYDNAYAGNGYCRCGHSYDAHY